MLKKAFFLLLFVFASSQLFPYKNVKVVLIASKDSQKDSLGYNIVTSLAEWTYQNLRAGKIKMWATPYKKEEMNFSTLQAVELSSGMNFTECNHIFLYEMWTSSKSSTAFSITGISFSTENQKGEMVSYGFIDYAEIEEQLKKDFITVNENGSYRTSFYQVLMNKRYDFEIVYFKDSPIQSKNSRNPEADYKTGLKIKQKAFNSSKLNLNYTPIKETKLVEYSIRTNDYDIKTTEIISALETYFNKSKKDLQKYGGSDIYKYFGNSSLILSECIIKEIWTMEGGAIYYNLLSVVPVSVGVSFNPIPAGDIERFSIIIEQQTLLSVFNGKQFRYHLLSVNGLGVDESNSDAYLKKLAEGKWNNLTVSNKQP